MTGRWVLQDEAPRQERRGRWQLQEVDRGTAFLRGLGDSVSLSFGDEIMGLGAGASAMLEGRDGRQAYERQVARSRANLQEAEERHPWSTGAGELTGYLVPGFGAGKLAKAGMGVGGRLAVATGTGAAIGGASGFGSGETMDERLQGAAMGGALGGAFGGGSQAVLGEALPAVVRQGQRWISGATGLPMSSGRASRVQMARDDLMATARQNPSLNVRNEQDVVALMNQAAALDPSLTVAEVMGQAGQGRLAALARAPGQTGQMVEDFFTARAANQGDDVSAALLGRSPAPGDTLEQQLQQQWRTMGPQLYEPVLNQPLGPQAEAAARALQQSDLFRHRAVATAWERAGAMIADDIALGRIAPNATNSLAHRLHYTKVAMDDMIADPTKLEPGIRNMSNASISAAREQLLGRVERIIPGYNAARAQMADIGQARRAIEQGRQAFTRQSFATPEALTRHVGSLSPAERPYFIAGVEDALANMIRGAGKDGRRNVAATMLSDQTQARLRAVFGQEADAMIERLRQIGRKFDFGQRVRPSTGSITSNIITQLSPGIAGAGLGAANTQDDPIMGAITGGALGFGAGALGRQALRNTLLRRMEQAAQRQRDMLGPMYLMPAGQFQQGQRGLLSTAARYDRRQRYRTRLDRTRGAYIAGTAGMGVYDAGEDR